MSRVRFYQLLVGISFVTYLASFFFPFFPISYDSKTQTLLEYANYGASIPAGHPYIYLSSFILRLVATIGLFLFLSWGRWLMLADVAINLMLAPFMGVQIFSPVDGVIGNLLSLLDGALLILCFSKPYAGFMKRDDGVNFFLTPKVSAESQTTPTATLDFKRGYKTLFVVLASVIITFLCTAYYIKRSSSQTIMEMVVRINNEMDSFNDIGRIEAYDFVEDLIKQGCEKEALEYIDYQKKFMLSELQNRMKENSTIRHTVMERNGKIGERAVKAIPHSGSYTLPSCKESLTCR